jgi:hypothetical protein
MYMNESRSRHLKSARGFVRTHFPLQRSSAMIRRVLFSTVALVAGSSLVALAAPKDEVADAAKKLSDAQNYSWKSTTEMAGGQGGRFGGPTEGKTEKGGFTHITMTRGDNTIEVVRKGDKGAVKTQDGWQSFEELQQNAGQGGQGQGRGRFMGAMLRNLRLPAEEATNLAGKTKELKKDGDAYAADLTEEGAKDLMTFRGARRGNNGGGQGNFTPPEPTNAKGTVKFWVKDGQLSKYEYNVKGTMSFGGNDIDVDRTTTVEVKDVGSTKVDVPAEAKSKIS